MGSGELRIFLLSHLHHTSLEILNRVVSMSLIRKVHLSELLNEVWI